MVKKRCNFTISNETKERLETLSNESYKYWGKMRSQSEIIDILIRTAFKDKRKTLIETIKKKQKEIFELGRELELLDKKRAENEI